MTYWQAREQSFDWSRLGRRLAGIFQTRTFQMLFALAAVALGAFLIYRSLSRYSFAELSSAVAAVPPWRVAASAACAAASYFCLTLFDYLGLRYAGKPLPYPKAALASFVSLSLGHTIGLAALSSGAVRYRYYSRWGLSAGDVAKVIVFCGFAVGLGLFGLAGIALLIAPETAQTMAGLSRGATYGLALAFLAVPLVYVVLAAFWRKPLVVRGWSMEMPGIRLALAQVAVGIANFVCVAACLHHALAGVEEVDFASVTSAYVVANVATLVTHVPGGLGVIETVVQHLLPGGNLVGPLLVFRFTYFIAPLLIGSVALIVSEVMMRPKKARK